MFVRHILEKMVVGPQYETGLGSCIWVCQNLDFEIAYVLLFDVKRTCNLVDLRVRLAIEIELFMKESKTVLGSIEPDHDARALRSL